MIKIHYRLICAFLDIDKWIAGKWYREEFEEQGFENMTISSYWGFLIREGKATRFHLWMNKHLRFLDNYLDWVGVIDGCEYDYSKFGHCEKWYHLYGRQANFVTMRDGKIYYGRTWRDIDEKPKK